MLTIGTRLTHAMQVRGVTQAALARAADVTVGHIAHMRRGTRGGGTRPDTIEKLAHALRVSPRWLATGEGPMDADPGPPLLRHRPEWSAMLARTLDEHPELPPEMVEAVGTMADTPGLPTLDTVFIRDMALALGALRARVARRTRPSI